MAGITGFPSLFNAATCRNGVFQDVLIAETFHKFEINASDSTLESDCVSCMAELESLSPTTLVNFSKADMFCRTEGDFACIELPLDTRIRDNATFLACSLATDFS